MSNCLDLVQDRQSVQIWVETVCKDYQSADDKVTASMEGLKKQRNFEMLSGANFSLVFTKSSSFYLNFKFWVGIIFFLFFLFFGGFH